LFPTISASYDAVLKIGNGISSSASCVIGQNDPNKENTFNLTNLKNRNALIQDIKNMNKTYSFVAIFDIDYFKDINDYFGFDSGDLLVKKISSIIRAHITTDEFKDYCLYHLSIDEFAIVYTNDDISKKDNFLALCKSIIEEIEGTTILLHHDNSVNISISGGLSYGENPLCVLKEASNALTYSKKHTIHLTDFQTIDELKNEVHNKVYWLEELKNIISHQGIIPWVQPIVDNRTQKVVKVEVLMRAVNSKGDIISPGYFLGVAKATRLYGKISSMLIKKTLIALRAGDINFNINLSWEDIKSYDTGTMMLEMLEEMPELGKKMTLEIVETESIENFKAFNVFLSKMREFGVKIALDDFGSGYSNFVYLEKINADIIKIDGSLIKNLSNSKTTRIVQAILGIARTFNVETVAEFVSDEKTFNEVKRLGIDYSQGYFFYKPMPIEEFLEIESLRILSPEVAEA